MSSWSMNDGSDLPGTHTFTQNSDLVLGNSSAAYQTNVKVGDIIVTNGGASVRVKDTQGIRTIPQSGINETSNVLTFTGHGYSDGTEIQYNANGGTLAAPLTDGQVVFVRDKDANTFKIAATSGGTAIDITNDGGDTQFFKGLTDTGLTLTDTFAGSTESGVAADVRRPPMDFDSSAPHINSNILGITSGESLGGLDNVTTISINVAGTCHRSAPSVTVAGPTARTITQAKIAEDATGLFTVDAGHGMRTGTKLTYGRDGSGTLLALGGSNVADGTAVFVVRVSDTTFGLNTNETNALAGTKLAVTNDGHDTQTFTGVTATATATVSAGKVTGYTITEVGSDYQSAPSVTVAAPTTETIDLTDSAKLIVADDEIACSAGFYGAIETGDAVTYSKGSGGTAAAGLTDTGVHFIIKSGTANKFSLATSLVNANAGTKIDLTAVAGGGTAHTFIGTTPTSNATLGLGSDDSVNTRQIAHTGWVKKTVGTGGRAGRVHYETLVASSSITGDAEDTATPDS